MIAIDLMPYIHTCAPQVAPSTMLAIIKTESHGNPWAIGLNGNKKLSYQPKTLMQATSWVEYLDKNAYNFDVGLAQVNIRNIHKYGYKAADMLDPCRNLQVASKILKQHYHDALSKTANSKDALFKAISAYNTGNYVKGFHNGYVQTVVYNATGIKINVTSTKVLSNSKTVVYAKNKAQLRDNIYAQNY